MSRDEQVDGVGLMIREELVREMCDGVGVFEEKPSAEGIWIPIERGDGLGEVVDEGGDGIARVEHGIEGGDGMLIWEDGVDDGVEDEFSTPAGDEPIMGEGDPGGC